MVKIVAVKANLLVLAIHASATHVSVRALMDVPLATRALQCAERVVRSTIVGLASERQLWQRRLRLLRHRVMEVHPHRHIKRYTRS